MRLTAATSCVVVAGAVVVAAFTFGWLAAKHHYQCDQVAGTSSVLDGRVHQERICR